MPAKSKAQQRFMGMVHAYKKGELKGSEVSKDVKDAAKGMKKKTAKDYAKTKHKGLPNKVKKEDLMRLIDKYGAKKVRETIMAVRPKAVTVSGNRMPEDPDFEYDPEKKTDEGFGGELKGKDKKKFEKARKENAEQLGYKVTGTSDTKKQTLKMANELNEGTCGYGIDGKLGDKPAGPHLLKARKKKKLEKEVSNPTSGIMMARKMSSLEMQQIILLAKAMKQLPGSPAQKKIKKQINVIRKKLGQAPVKESVSEAPFSSSSQLPYSSKEAQIQVDKDLNVMSKYLGKASQQVIKTMMNGVKSGKYDAMDLMRGIKSGNVRATHYGERDFIQQLWNKVREKFRKYSKRGKLR